MALPNFLNKEHEKSYDIYIERGICSNSLWSELGAYILISLLAANDHLTPIQRYVAYCTLAGLNLQAKYIYTAIC